MRVLSNYRVKQIEGSVKVCRMARFNCFVNSLPPPRKIFILKRKEELCGVIVYSYPPPVTFGRTKVWKGSIQELQLEVSAISRVIVHPKYRSIGLGEKLVSETLAQAGTPCVETVAVMAKYNPFFEKAGLQKISESKPSTHIINAFAKLEMLGFDSALMAGALYNQQKIEAIGAKPVIDVLEELSLHEGSVRRRVAALKNIYPKHEEFKDKISKFSDAELALALKKFSFASQSKFYLFWRKKIVIRKIS
jgi:GNAT superfamily N-acetyltransferase